LLLSQEVEQEVKALQAEADQEKEPEMSILEVIRSPSLRVALTVCLVMHLSQQLSGMVAIFYYSISFFTSAGIDEEQAQYANLGVGAILVAMTLVTVPLMDRLGRRVLHLGGLAGMCAMAVLIVIAQVPPDLLSSSFPPQSLDGAPGLLIAATLGFVMFFALGPGSIPWMIAGEMFTQGPRPAASALVVGVNWAANLAVSLLFPLVLIPELGRFTFLPFAVLIGLFFVFIFLYLPETRGRTVGETTSLLQERGWTPGRGR
jgi:SP family facilitated glucose transporter-like MFS transporter 1